MKPSWKNHFELSEVISDWPESSLEKLVNARRLAVFIRGCLFEATIDKYSSLVASIHLSDHAKDIIRLDQKLGAADDVSIKLAALSSLYHHDILIDIDLFDDLAFEQELSNLIVSRDVIFPHRFGRSLYDRFSKMFSSDRQDSLDPESSKKLLIGSEQGVYQVGPYVCGPIGIVRSIENRIAGPSRSVPLWHCDNIGCSHLHEVRLNDNHSAFRDIADRIDSVAQNILGPHSHWGVVISSIEDDHDAVEYSDLFSVVQEGLSKNEAKTLLIDLLSSSKNKSQIWSVLHKAKNLTSNGKDPKRLVEGATIEAVYQLIFSVSNEDIILSIDKLIADGSIVVPSPEVRKSRDRVARLVGRHSGSSISSLGIRSDTGNPSGRIALEVWNAYNDAGRLADLSWKTVKRSGPAAPGDVLDYLTQHDPADAVNDLVLGSKDVSETIFESIGFTIHDEVHERSVDRILWKFGYSFPRFGNELGRIGRHLDGFKKIVLTCTDPLSLHDKEAIRSAGVNLFVNLEWFVEHLISYNVWWLENDHSIDQFMYDVDKSVALVPHVLSGNEYANWDPKGGNTLGVLLVYLSSMLDWMKNLSIDSATHRLSDEYPHFVDAESEIFPFHYKEMWACYDPASLKKYCADIKEVASLLLQSDLAAVRNGLDHFRKSDQFPTLDLMLACESRVRQAIDLADIRRLAPKHWWLRNRLSDNVGRVVETFVDEAGDKLNVSYPSALAGLPDADYGEAVIIAPGNPLGQANATILLKPVESSEYVKMWSDYPARAVVELGENSVVDVDESQSGDSSFAVDS